jgi:hypothetical protein
MLSVIYAVSCFLYCCAECHYAGCHYAECRVDVVKAFSLQPQGFIKFIHGAYTIKRFTAVIYGFS